MKAGWLILCRTCVCLCMCMCVRLCASELFKHPHDSLTHSQRLPSVTYKRGKRKSFSPPCKHTIFVPYLQFIWIRLAVPRIRSDGFLKMVEFTWWFHNPDALISLAANMCLLRSGRVFFWLRLLHVVKCEAPLHWAERTHFGGEIPRLPSTHTSLASRIYTQFGLFILFIYFYDGFGHSTCTCRASIIIRGAEVLNCERVKTCLL